MGQVCGPCRKGGVKSLKVEKLRGKGLAGPRVSISALIQKQIRVNKRQLDMLSILVKAKSDKGEYDPSLTTQANVLSKANAVLIKEARAYEFEAKQLAEKMTHEQKREIIRDFVHRLPAEQRKELIEEIEATLSSEMYSQ